MSEFYKMEPLKWDRGTDDLTLEQEAAYLRVCNAIYAADQPVRENYRVLAGMWRCNERKAKRLLAELIEAGKLEVEDGWITNRKAMEDVSKRRALRIDRQLAGRLGGIESGKVRAKPLTDNEMAEANASTRKEVETEIEAEKKVPPFNPPKPTRPDGAPTGAEFERVWAAYPKKVGKGAARKKWASVRKKVPFETIAGPLRAYVRAVKGTDPQFIVSLARWLNESRWEDEPDHAANRPRTSDEDLNHLSTVSATDDLERLFAAPQLRLVAQ